MPESNQTLRGAAARIAPDYGRRCPNRTKRPGLSGLYQPPRVADTRGDVDACEVEVDSDGEVDAARDDLDAREVEVDSDGEVDARDDLDAHAVLAMEHVEEAVVLLLQLT
eukprot:1753389-Prymnesium_polylepis.1